MVEGTVKNCEARLTMTGDYELIFTIDKSLKNKVSAILELFRNNDKPKKLKVEIERKKRSLNANNYSWVLITEMANVIGISKEEMYINMLKDYGQIATDINGEKIIFSVRSDVDAVGYYKYLMPYGRGNVNGVDFTHYKVLKGSSEFDTKEMSIFLEGIISECKKLGIDTMTPEEIERLKQCSKAG